MQLRWSRAAWHFFLDTMKFWGKGYFEASVALVALLVSDNILAFTTSPFYQPLAYGSFVAIVVIGMLFRKRKWFQTFRKLTLRASAWIIATIAIVLLKFAENDAYFFDGLRLSNYNLLVTVALLFLILLPSPLFMVSDLSRDLETRLEADRTRRMPTIFNPDYIVPQKRSIFDRIVSMLQDS